MIKYAYFTLAVLFVFLLSLEAQTDSMFVVIREGLGFGTIECYNENPFTVSDPMVFDEYWGLTEVNHMEGMREPLALLVEVDVMSFHVLYDHPLGNFLVGFDCPTRTDTGVKELHMRNPSWGVFDWYLTDYPE